MKINLPAGTQISFNNDPTHLVYHLSYQEVLGPCPPNCSVGGEHECFTDPYIAVYYTIGTTMPLKDLKYVFDEKTHMGKIIEDPLKLLK